MSNFDRDFLRKKIIEEAVPGFRGILPQRLDYRDIKLQSILPIKSRPRRVRWANPIPIYNQFDWGTCVANAIGFMGSYFFWKEYGRVIPMSRRYIYERSRMIDGMGPGVEGTDNRSGLATLARYGVPFETDYIYDYWDKTLRVPTPALDKLAFPQRILTYASVTPTLDGILNALSNGPVVVGHLVFTNTYPKTGAIMGSIPEGYWLGAHDVVFEGYDEDTGFIDVRNSWGEEAGDKGFFKLPFEAFDWIWDMGDIPMFFDPWTLVDFVAPKVPGIPDVIYPDKKPVKMFLNGSEIVIPENDAPAMVQVVNGTARTMVPVRAVTERFGATVNFVDLGDHYRIDFHK